MLSKENWSIERVATLLTPIFTGVTTIAVAWVEKHFPGAPRLDANSLAALEVATTLSGGAAVVKWLHGRQNIALLLREDATKPAATAPVATASGQIAAPPQS